LDAEVLVGDTGVCRNTYIESVVDGYLDPQTVNNMILL
jgi:hypothetical protein